MAKKKSMVYSLNGLDKPYNLQIQIGGKVGEYVASVNLTIMSPIQVVDGKSVQPTHRIVSTQGFGDTISKAKDAALTEALQFAGVI